MASESRIDSSMVSNMESRLSNPESSQGDILVEQAQKPGDEQQSRPPELHADAPEGENQHHEDPEQHAPGESIPMMGQGSIIAAEKEARLSKLEYFGSITMNREVVVRNQKLVNTYWLLWLGTAAILIFLCFQRILLFDYQKSHGYVYLTVNGNAYSTVNNQNFAWDHATLIPSQNEKDGVFIPTRIKITKNQNPSVCPSSFFTCTSNTDCENYISPTIKLIGDCFIPTSKCLAQQWCPTEDVENPKITEVHDLENLENFMIGIRSFISFPLLEPDGVVST
eukprot:TRINITY_DN7568_c0_g1_i2.p1 TRINITY_DN7568_c0_g1~~TRINITY_DN7568_c0_g1_i2.p1  ORF type:complete len:281 (-),score=24.31 TRINITY_DN7568_c0_g1_i2:471-1313(-)